MLSQGRYSMLRIAMPARAVGLRMLLTAQTGALARTIACGTLSKVKTGFDRAVTPMTMASLDFLEVPNTRIIFNVAGKSKSCVIVTYSARMQAVAPEQLWLRVILDGKVVAEPGALIATTNDASGEYRAHSYTWVFPSVSPGKRNVRVEIARAAAASCGSSSRHVGSIADAAFRSM